MEAINHKKKGTDRQKEAGGNPELKVPNAIKHRSQTRANNTGATKATWHPTERGVA